MTEEAVNRCIDDVDGIVSRDPEASALDGRTCNGRLAMSYMAIPAPLGQ